MATVTGATLLAGIQSSTGITLNAVLQGSLAAKLQQLLDSGTYSAQAASAFVQGFSSQFLTFVQTSSTPASFAAHITTVNTALTNGTAIPDIAGTPVVTPVSFTLTAADSVNEGVANTFTVTASKPVAADTVVTFQLATGTAQLADFGAGSFNAVTVTIPKDGTTAKTSYTAITNDGTELSETYSVTASVAGAAAIAPVTATILDGAVGAGQTFTLTKDLDIIPGLNGSNGNSVTSGNDTIIGVIEVSNVSSAATASANSTLNATDLIDAGQGTDTLKVVLAGAVTVTSTDYTVPTNFGSIETLELQSSATFFDAGEGVILNTASVTGLTTINVTKSADVLKLTAAAATDVNVTAKAAGAALTTAGGKNVTVKLTDVAATADVVTIGTSKGDTVVEMTGSASVAATDATLSAVNVNSGKTISVTQKATGNAAAAAADTTGATITQGAVTVAGDTTTTTVTVKQDASASEVLAVAAVAAVASTQDVTFAAMTAGQTVAVDFGTGILTFTANKALTGAEAASAFANLAKDSLQGNASASLGIYTDATGGVSNGWSSGAVQTVTATTSKVTFTSASAATAIINGSGTVASVPGAYSGNAVAAVPAKTGVLGVANGAVSVTDANNVVKTITVDGYGAISSTTSTSALETLSLANAGLTYDVLGNGQVDGATAAGNITVADTAATLALNLQSLGFVGYYNGDAATTLQTTDVIFTAAPTTLNVKVTGANYVDLQAQATETLAVSGAGSVLFNQHAANGLDGLKTIKVTDTASLSLGAPTTNNITSVDTTSTTGTVSVQIDGQKATYAGGAGVDILTVTNASTTIIKAIDLGAGNDTLDLSATPAVDPTAELKGGDGVDTLKLSSAAAVARTSAVTFQDKITGFEQLSVADVTATGTVNLDNLDDINYVITAGTVGDFGLVLDKMLTGATVVLGAAHSASTTQAGVEVKLASTTPLTDVVNFVANATTGASFGSVKANGVETINITANDTDSTVTATGVNNVSTNTMNLVADKAATVTVAGAGNLVLTLDATSTAVTLIDGSTATGKLTVTTLASDLGATTVKGGTAADTLTAQGANDVLQGGAGADTLKVMGSAASATTLTGGDGVDKFDVSGFTAANAGAAATITDFTRGETIKFVSNVSANFASSKVVLIAEATFDNYVTEAAKAADLVSGGTHGVAWFQFGGNTFVVQDVNGDAAFTNSADIIVKLTGTVDLSASSFNEVGEGTLLFI